MKVAAIDLGTNSFLCLVVEGNQGKIEKVISDEVQITRLGEGVHANRQFTAGALARAKECLQKFKSTIDQIQPEKVLAIATSAARDVKNGEQLQRICDELEIPLEVISGDKEAQYTFDGATLDYNDRNGFCVIDVGGGSTEVLCLEGNCLVGQSLDIGAVRLTEMFVKSDPITSNEFSQIQTYIQGQLSKLPNIRAKKVIAVAGTPTALVCAELKKDFDHALVHNYCLTSEVLRFWMEKLSRSSISERAKFNGIGNKRADVIVSGTMILYYTLRYLGLSEMYVSTKGLRYGLARKLLGAK